jgi:hypothetical protein
MTERILASTITPTLSEIEPKDFLPSSRSLLLTKDAWTRAGGYPEWLDYCEDLVFDLRLIRAGYTFDFAPRAIARWSARDSFRAYAKQYYRYARGDGKAGLWPKRHIARYCAYGIGLTGFIVSGKAKKPMRTALLIGLLSYMRKFFVRAWRRRDGDALGSAVAVTAVPAVIVIGDISKMVGYPVGLWWRFRHSRRAGSEG